MKDKPVTGPPGPASRKHRYLGGALVDIDTVINRLEMLRLERDGTECAQQGKDEGANADADDWENEEVEESDLD